METLINKIKEFTQDGPPGVGQLIELNDLAKKVGIKKSELEKLITEANFAKNRKEPVTENEETEIEDISSSDFDPDPVRNFDRPAAQNYEMPTYERPDLDSARDSFEAEMKLRQESEKDKLESNTPTFDQPEVVFPELNVTFGDKEKEEMQPDKPDMEHLEMPEIVQEDFKSEFETPVMETQEIHINKPVFEEPKSTPKPTENTITFEPQVEETTIENNEEELEDDFTFTENGNEIPSFEDALKNTQERLNKEDILRKIIAQNKAAKENAEKNSSTYSKSSRKTSSQQKKSTVSKGETVTLEQSKSAKITGIVAIIASFLPFFFIGLIAGIYGFNVAKGHKENVEQNPQLYGSTITNNINLAYFLSIAGAVIAGIRLITITF